jgi:thiol-disulfide isomerase/thioredoxin
LAVEWGMKKVLIVLAFLVVLSVVVYILLPDMCCPGGQSDSSSGNQTLLVELETPGGPLPFLIDVVESEDDGWLAGIHDLERTTQLYPIVEGEVSEIKIPFKNYDSALTLEGELAVPYLKGNWVKNRGPGKQASMNVSVRKAGDDDAFLFEPVEGAGQPSQFQGQWKVRFESSDDFAVAKFGMGPGPLHTGAGMENFMYGTFLTTTGDYGMLKGRVDGNLMRLSTFDGAHAFLFHARMQDDGTIEGDFWSGNWWHETWTAVRDENAALPDAFEQTTIADEDALNDMVFKNLQGEPTRVLDVLDESNAPARIIEIFGTWCPNCSDAGRELVSLREQFGDDLAVVGLAFEVTEDFERSVQQVRHHHEHIGTDWPILIAGLSDKDKASQALPVLDKVRSYPTLIFLDRNNEVQGVYSGFSGPATGDAYIKQRERFEALIESMID